MLSPKLVFCVALVSAGVFGAPQAARAAIIDYTFSGVFTGSLGATSYTDQSFAVNLIGDTSGVTSDGGELSNIATSATFTIGSTTGSLLGLYNDVVLNPSFSSGTIIFGQAQSTSPYFVGEGLAASALGSYDLVSALALTPGSVSQTTGSVYFTSLGNLVFSDISSASFQAQLSPVPLPSSLPLFAAGLGLMGMWGWYQRKKSV